MANKTNALRMLDKEKIAYWIKEYQVNEEGLSGEHLIKQLGLKAEEVYKTLVLIGDKKEYLVACIPVDKEIDLKKLAKLSHHKKVEMLHQKDLLSITGYIRGGCSPIGMKKLFPTYFQEDILQLKEVYVSAGKRGLQVILSPQDLIHVVKGQIGDMN